MTRQISDILLTALFLLLMAGGCASDTDGDSPDMDGDTLTLHFRICSAVNETGQMTRTDNEGHDEIPSEYPYFEEAVNVNDFAFFIFAGDGDGAPLIYYSTGLRSSGADDTSVISGGPGLYNVTVRLQKSVMETYLQREPASGSATVIPVRIVAVANSRALKDASSSLLDNLTFTAINDAAGTPSIFSDVINAAKGLEYKMTADSFYVASGNGIPEGIKGLIPMFGMKQFDVSKSALRVYGPGNQIYLGEVNLLRSVAKIRVKDNIPRRFDTDYPAISRIEFQYAVNTGYILPDVKNYKDDMQVHTANIPKQEKYSNSISFLHTDEKEFTVYTTEQIITHVPIIKIWVKPSPEENEILYNVPMSGYGDIKFDWNNTDNSLLRNHIYTLEVTGLKNLSVVWVVCPMDRVTVEIPDFE